ncbi:MAG: metallophosphoesterase, partial [Candidatus Falkowbacteria bacterium]|nr:metallophosphoesterase [Candidatus Falkowbacteria bacterium]
ANVAGLNIIGADFIRDFGNKQSIEELLKKVRADEANIFLYHEPLYIEMVKNSGVSLQLAGHTHDGQQFPFQFFTWLIYKKYYNGLHVEDNYTSYTSNGAGTWGPPLRIGNTPEVVAITLN